MNAFPGSPALTASTHRNVVAGPAAAPSGTPFSLVADAGGESALYVDWRFGFSHGLPGGPRLLPASVDPSAPACDASVGFRDIDVVVGYRASAPLVHARDAEELAVKQAQLHIDARFGGRSPVAARLVRGPQLGAFAASAAASAEYKLPVADAEGHTHEELLLLVRGGHTMQITFRYAKDAAPALALATFFSVVKASLSWDPRRPTIAPLLWPESTYLGPGLESELLPARIAQAPALVRAFAMDPREGVAVSEVLESFVAGDEPPWLPLSPAAVEAHAQALLTATSAPAFASMVRSVIADVRTVRDLRGFAILLAKAATLAWTPAESAASPAREVAAPPAPAAPAAPAVPVVDERFFQPAAVLPGSTPPPPFASPPHTVLVPQLAALAVPAPVESVEVLLDAEPDADSARPADIVVAAPAPAFRVPPPQPPARRPPSLAAPPPKPMSPLRPN